MKKQYIYIISLKIYIQGYSFILFQLEHNMKTTDNMVVRWAKECRKMCVELCMVNGCPIGGLDVNAEIDETKIGEITVW